MRIVRRRPTRRCSSRRRRSPQASCQCLRRTTERHRFWLELSFDAPLAQGSKPQLQSTAQRDRGSGVEIPAEGRAARPLADPGRSDPRTERRGGDARAVAALRRIRRGLHRRRSHVSRPGWQRKSTAPQAATTGRTTQPEPRSHQFPRCQQRVSGSSGCCWHCSAHAADGTTATNLTLERKITDHASDHSGGKSATPTPSRRPARLEVMRLPPGVTYFPGPSGRRRGLRSQPAGRTHRAMRAGAPRAPDAERYRTRPNRTQRPPPSRRTTGAGTSTKHPKPVGRSHRCRRPSTTRTSHTALKSTT